ncbi:hypothetical protein RN001_001066 [Aquatica leii]|uniref:Hydin adenylate kinase-like domain-containing protein n=1 Tax=Aquatica leii TaxID=1421715 RepID=A0AAN7QA43_9COLE|nr:hypothetical protein RN001_001066 [Aquatica leii]
MTTQYPEIQDLDELFGFAEARKRAEEAAENEDIYNEPNFIQRRVFINHIDKFNGKHLAVFLSEQVFGSKQIPDDFQATEEEVPEEDDEQEVLEEEEDVELEQPVGGKYEVIGSLYKYFHKPPEEVLFTTDEQDGNFITNVMKCGFVVYDITQDPNEIPKALSTLTEISNEVEKIKLPAKSKKPQDIRVFILISNIVTWALTKPIDPEDPSLPFTENDFRKRRVHPNFKTYIDCEREVMMIGRKNKEKLKTYVICAGIIYGMEEEDLIFFFKLAWYNEKELPIFKQGKNVLPLIHIKDLAKVLFCLMEKTPSKPQLILAVEQTPSNFKQIVKALSKAMGSGRTKTVSAEEAFLYKEMTQNLYDRYTLNLTMEPGCIIDQLEIEWTNELNLAENIKNIVKEFKQTRGLTPVRIIIHGPPAAGKTRIAKQLANYYGSHYVNIKTLIEETIQEYKDAIEREKARIQAKEEKDATKEEGAEEDEGVEEEEDEEEDAGVDIEELNEKIKNIETAIAENENGKLPEEQITELLRSYLGSNKAQNQGYVLDGYPKTIDQATELFAVTEPGDDEEILEEEEGGFGPRSPLLPDFVVSLEATDEFLCERVMVLPEEEIQGTHYAEVPMLRRLAEFRTNNTDDNTPLNFFNELEIHPVVLNVMEDKSENMDNIMKILFTRFGPAKGFPLTPEEEEELLRLEHEKQKLLELENKMKRELLEKQAVAEHQIKMEQWTEILEQLQREEEKLLIAQAEPLRNYLLKFIFPTLAKGLVETARVRPDDPVDFLAEYLFKENPEGHMFDPSYTREGKRILDNFSDTVDKNIENLSGTDPEQ